MNWRKTAGRDDQRWEKATGEDEKSWRTEQVEKQVVCDNCGHTVSVGMEQQTARNRQIAPRWNWKCRLT